MNVVQCEHIDVVIGNLVRFFRLPAHDAVVLGYADVGSRPVENFQDIDQKMDFRGWPNTNETLSESGQRLVWSQPVHVVDPVEGQKD
ncbi:hypothetical protein DYBT9623_05542 [Dyadobacter sp. CECT 9623]|uniref:Uncharacterized protein n=1 Tax=Dyadobacter linearis TaxID=2823330 RepID=A0ABM8UZ32_9BACT|nr:hypothetical protein DYBT9623_05542 [Dyadobacter sp. CECT 9623]